MVELDEAELSQRRGARSGCQNGVQSGDVRVEVVEGVDHLIQAVGNGRPAATCDHVMPAARLVANFFQHFMKVKIVHTWAQQVADFSLHAMPLPPAHRTGLALTLLTLLLAQRCFKEGVEVAFEYFRGEYVENLAYSLQNVELLAPFGWRLWHREAGGGDGCGDLLAQCGHGFVQQADHADRRLVGLLMRVECGMVPGGILRAQGVAVKFAQTHQLVGIVIELAG